MIDPEISRRCPECGAFVKGRALSCPQCGHAFVKTADRAVDSNVAEKEAKVITHPPVKARLPSDAQTELARRKTDASARQATAASGGVIEDNAPRAEKSQPSFSAVLDGSGSDSGFRFVIVAAALFVLFLLLLLLSKWLR